MSDAPKRKKCFCGRLIAVYHKAPKRCQVCIRDRYLKSVDIIRELGDEPVEARRVRREFYPERMKDILNSKSEFWSMEDHWLINRFNLNVCKGMGIVEAYFEAEQWAGIMGKLQKGVGIMSANELYSSVKNYHPKDGVLEFNRTIHYATREKIVVERWLDEQGLNTPDEEESPQVGQDF